MKILLLLILLIPGFNNAIWVSEIFTLNYEPAQVYTDNLNHFYTVSNNEIQKFDDKGVLLYMYSNKKLGEIHSLDVSYSLRPLVFYKNQNSIVLLDNTLSDNRTPVNLLDKEIYMPALVCNSVQNFFWIYDAQNYELLRVNENFIPQSRSGNLSQMISYNLKPAHMLEAENRLYLNNPETGILVFDLFGTYIKTIPIKAIFKFKVFENELLYLKNNKLMIYNMLDHSEKERIMPRDSVKTFDSNTQQLIISYPGMVSGFKYVNEEK